MIALLVLFACPQASDPVVDPSDSGTDGGSDGGTWGPDCAIEDLDPATLPSVSSPCREPELVWLNRVVDGDTIEVRSSNWDEKIRMIGVDTPEVDTSSTDEECYGPEASAFTKASLAEGSCLWLTFDRECTDYYDRTLAYVHLGAGEQDFYQRRLLREGYASVLIYEPNDAFEETFREDESAAKAADAGLWGVCE